MSTEVTGRVLAANTQIQLAFPEPGKLTVQAGCNHLSGDVIFDGDRLKISEMGSTAMGCDQARHEQDTWMTAFLTAAPKYALTGDELVLTGNTEQIKFVDQNATQPDTLLLGTRWVVQSLLDGQAASSVPQGAHAFLQFDGDTVTGNDGCHQFSGKVVHHTGTIVFSEAKTTKMACTGSRRALQAAVLATLNGQVTTKIDSGQLELRNANGNGLLLRAATQPRPTTS